MNNFVSESYQREGQSGNQNAKERISKYMWIYSGREP